MHQPVSWPAMQWIWLQLTKNNQYSLPLWVPCPRASQRKTSDKRAYSGKCLSPFGASMTVTWEKARVLCIHWNHLIRPGRCRGVCPSKHQQHGAEHMDVLVISLYFLLCSWALLRSQNLLTKHMWLCEAAACESMQGEKATSSFRYANAMLSFE